MINVCNLNVLILCIETNYMKHFRPKILTSADQIAARSVLCCISVNITGYQTPTRGYN